MRTIQFRRKLEGKTNYRKRLRMLATQKIRLVVRPSLKHISAQIVEFEPRGDKVIAGVHSKKLEGKGWKLSAGNMPAAYLTGYMLGKIAADRKINEAVLDTGVRTPIKRSRIYACVKGVIDAGVNVPCKKEVLPSQERISGKHISEKTVSLFTDTKKNIEEKQ